MNYPPPVPRLPQKPAYRLPLSPTPAWIGIVGLVVFTALGIMAGLGKIMNLVCPLGALAIGALLYFRYPILYVSFSWWLWFLTPLVRRLADYRSSYTESSPMLLAPYLVSGLTIITLWRRLPSACRQGGLPFVLSLAGVFYGLLVGLIYTRPTALAEPFLAWFIPVVFGFHLFVNWQDYPRYRQTIQRTFLWGVLIMGLYGVAQFITFPDWDRLWLAQSGLSSAGSADSTEGVRVWSTMNSGEPFAAYMAGGLLLLFSCKGPWILPTAAAGYLAFFLSTVRSAWLGWLAGLFVLASFLKQSLQIRLIGILIIIGLCVIPLATMDAFSENIATRLSSLS
ncbi:MAG TPA: O-antigen ligase domain-containing protein, partial [Allocoleopsis sp.]